VKIIIKVPKKHREHFVLFAQNTPFKPKLKSIESTLFSLPKIRLSNLSGLRARLNISVTQSTKELEMNDWDRDNLNFLLNTKGEDFEAFWAQADEDDRVYAQELLDAYSRELKFKAEELRIESELMLQEYNGNYPEAKRVIDALMKR